MHCLCSRRAGGEPISPVIQWRGSRAQPVFRTPAEAVRSHGSRKEAAYPVLTWEDRRRLAFGAGDRKHRTRLEVDQAFENLPGLVIVSRRAVYSRTGEVGWRILPTDAAATIGEAGGDEDANRGR